MRYSYSILYVSLHRNCNCSMRWFPQSKWPSRYPAKGRMYFADICGVYLFWRALPAFVWHKRIFPASGMHDLWHQNCEIGCVLFDCHKCVPCHVSLILRCVWRTKQGLIGARWRTIMGSFILLNRTFFTIPRTWWFHDSSALSDYGWVLHAWRISWKIEYVAQRAGQVFKAHEKHARPGNRVTQTMLVWTCRSHSVVTTFAHLSANQYRL